MGSKVRDIWNGWKKSIISGIITGLLAVIPATVTIGEYKNKVDEMEKKMTTHLDIYTPSIAGDYQLTKTKVAVQQEQILTLQKSLDEIKEQNKTIIKLMRSHKQ